jgi:hypothetical protein
MLFPIATTKGLSSAAFSIDFPDSPLSQASAAI